MVTRERCALIGRIQVEHILVSRLGHHGPEVERRDLGAVRHQVGNLYQLSPHGVRVHPEASIVRTLVEVPFRVVAHGALDDSCQQVEKEVGLAGAVEPFPDTKEERPPVSPLLPPQAGIVLRQRFRPLQNLGPQRHERTVVVVQPESPRAPADGRRQRDGRRPREGLDQSPGVGWQVEEDVAGDGALASLVGKRMRRPRASDVVRRFSCVRRGSLHGEPREQSNRVVAKAPFVGRALAATTPQGGALPRRAGGYCRGSAGRSWNSNSCWQHQQGPGMWAVMLQVKQK